MSGRSASDAGEDRFILAGFEPARALTFDRLSLVRFTLPARSGRLSLRSRKTQQVSCIFVAEGSLSVSFAQLRSRRSDVAPRQGCFLRSRNDYLLSWDGETELIVATMKEELVLAFGATIDDDSLLFARSSALVDPALAFLRETLTSAVNPSAVATYALSRLSEELVGSLFLERSSIRIDKIQPPPSLFHRALALIASQRAELSLSSATIARQLAVSVRHLQRAFSEQRTSPSAEIRRLRVELAIQLLTEPQYRVLSIADIASFSGFRTVDDLRRSFRLERIPAPSQVRIAAERGTVARTSRKRRRTGRRSAPPHPDGG